LIGGTGYTGEMKKIFSALNFIPVDQNTLPMHCSANVGDDGDTVFGCQELGNYSYQLIQKKLIESEHGWTNENTVLILKVDVMQSNQLNRRKRARYF
jgi:phosphoenolpyruvate carboxykinase (ATP)